MLVKKVKISLTKPDPETIIIPALTGIHSFFGGGIIMGTVLLFMVFASITGLGSASGKAPPEMSALTSVIMTITGAILLFGGNWLRNSFKSFYILDKRKKMVLLRHQFSGNFFKDSAIIRLDHISGVSVRTRTAEVTAREIFDLLFTSWIYGLMRKKQEAKTSEDTALVATLVNGSFIYLSHFENGQDNADAAFDAAREIDSWLDISDEIRQNRFREDFISPPQPPLTVEILKWTLLIGFLIWITYLLIASTMD